MNNRNQVQKQMGRPEMTEKTWTTNNNHLKDEITSKVILKGAVKLHLCWWHRLRQSLVRTLLMNHLLRPHTSFVHLRVFRDIPAFAVMNFFHEFRHKFPVPRNQGWNREHQIDASPMGRCLAAHHPSKRKQCLVRNTVRTSRSNLEFWRWYESVRKYCMQCITSYVILYYIDP